MKSHRSFSLLATWIVLVTSAQIMAFAAEPAFVNSIKIAGDLKDLSKDGNGGAQNRLGGFGSDLWYDAAADRYYGLVDRGPGGGALPYETRVQQFTLKVDPNTGAIGEFRLTRTIRFKTADGSAAFIGNKPSPPSKLGRSLDPEGFVIGKNGHYFVSDEYAPAIYEFQAAEANGEIEARHVRTFETPARLLPKTSGGDIDYVGARPQLVSGRQDNHGFEGLAITPDGQKLYAILQGPLVEEGPQGDGRRGCNVRLVEFDVTSGKSTAQYVYQLEPIADINARIAETDERFKPTQQGRGIGISALFAIGQREFLVLERDNRGRGVDDPTGKHPVGSKRVYRISLDLKTRERATDVSNVTLGGNDLPTGIQPVEKELYLDLQAALKSAGLATREKIEGICFGPKLADGSTTLLLGTDNDFSVTQPEGAANRQDVYTDGKTVEYRDVDAPTKFDGKEVGRVPAGFELLPTLLYSFRVR